MAFEAGVVVFFRTLAPDNTLARSVMPSGRAVIMHTRGGGINPFYHPEDYVVVDENDEVLGIYPREWVAAIMPLETVGPANVTDQPPGRNSAPAPAEGDPQGQPRRTKRLNPH